MPENVKTARTCLVVAGCLMLATAGFFLFILIVGSSFVGWGSERFGLLGNALLGAAGFFLLGLTAVVGVIELAAAAAVAKRRTWGRILGIILAILMLPLFPVGTVLGIFILLGLLGGGAREWFGGRASADAFRPIPPHPAGGGPGV